MNFLQTIGSFTFAFLETIGRLVSFTGTALLHSVRPPFYPRIVLKQMIEIGFFSLPVVGLTAIFAGMVLALQSFTGFSRFSAESAIPNVVVLSITRELGFNASNYLQNTYDFVEFIDVFLGLVKAAVFGFLITLMGCYHGYHSKGGAQGVGQATTNAVVSSSILILCFNYILTELFFAANG